MKEIVSPKEYGCDDPYSYSISSITSQYLTPLRSHPHIILTKPVRQSPLQHFYFLCKLQLNQKLTHNTSGGRKGLGEKGQGRGTVTAKGQPMSTAAAAG